jgi:hypothetical protein
MAGRLASPGTSFAQPVLDTADDLPIKGDSRIHHLEARANPPYSTDNPHPHGFQAVSQAVTVVQLSVDHRKTGHVLVCNTL